MAFQQEEDEKIYEEKTISFYEDMPNKQGTVISSINGMIEVDITADPHVSHAD